MSARDEFGLLPRQRLFADEWLTGANTGKRFNGRAAYEYAGYDIPEANPSTNASKLRRHPKVDAYIKKRLAEATMSPEEVAARISEVARNEVGDILKVNENGHLAIDEEEVLKRKSFVKSFKHDSNGNPVVEFHDSMTALDRISKIHGMQKDGMMLMGAGGGALTLELVFVEPDGTQKPVMADGNAEADEGPQEDFSEFDEYPDE